MSNYTMEGTVVRIDEPQTVGSKGAQKQQFVIGTGDSKYPQEIAFECWVDNGISPATGLSPGMKVAVQFDIRGREWQGRYYVNLNAWRATPLQRAQQQAQQRQQLDENDTIPF